MRTELANVAQPIVTRLTYNSCLTLQINNTGGISAMNINLLFKTIYFALRSICTTFG